LILSEIAKIAGIVYIVDVLEIILNVIGIKFPREHDISKMCAEALFTLYAAWRLTPYKKYVIKKRVMRKSDQDDASAKAKIKVYDSLFNIAIVVTTVFLLVDELKIPVGRALQSVFALGGVGTLVFSLASQDLASQIINGIALVASNKYDEGDLILLGDGTLGIVRRMGWVYTDLRGTDEVVVKIPNSQLANQRVSNLSRLKISQVKQLLWFAYEDVDKLPTVIENIKTEIGASCPNLITDGSRPFRVIWTDFRDDHLEVSVDCRFRHPPSTDVYWDTRQKVLLAISRAAKKSGVEFSIPNVRVKTSKRESSGEDLQQQYGIEDQATKKSGSDPGDSA
jgi:small-conductance mechanosensitive channel